MVAVIHLDAAQTNFAHSYQFLFQNLSVAPRQHRQSFGSENLPDSILECWLLNACGLRNSHPETAWYTLLGSGFPDARHCRLQYHA